MQCKYSRKSSKVPSNSVRFASGTVSSQYNPKDAARCEIRAIGNNGRARGERDNCDHENKQ